jgi:hypothetical protein
MKTKIFNKMIRKKNQSDLSLSIDPKCKSRSYQKSFNICLTKKIPESEQRKWQGEEVIQ